MSEIVLVVDSDVDCALHIRDQLADLGYEIICAYDSGQAIDFYMRRRPGYVVIDINMPGHDGLWLAQTILNIDYKSVIFLTSALEDSLQKAFNCQMAVAAIMAKPLDFERLKTMIKPYHRVDG